ncbi:unnamed protein product [Discosporangium mesarthrocarpum]
MSRTMEPVMVNGIRNWGNTCYRNSFLQALANICQFVDFLEKSGRHVGTFTTHLRDTMRDLHPLQLGMKPVPIAKNPSKVHQGVARTDSRFASNQQQDAEEFCQGTLGTLNNDPSPSSCTAWGLLPVFAPWEIGGGKPGLSRCLPIPVRDTNPMRGLLTSVVECPECGYEGRTEESFQVLSLSLPEAQAINGEHLASGCEILMTSAGPSAQPLKLFSAASSVKGKFSESAGVETIAITECLDEFTKEQIVEGFECSRCAVSQSSKIAKQMCGGAEGKEGNNGNSCWHHEDLSNGTALTQGISGRTSLGNQRKEGKEGRRGRDHIHGLLDILSNLDNDFFGVGMGQTRVLNCAQASVGGGAAEVVEPVKVHARKKLLVSELPGVLCLHLHRRQPRWGCW